ncbi:MAG: ATP-grasp domain-containing protein [Candidatus Nanoarchaeia archaeon]
MNYVVEKELNKDIFLDEYEYFFTFLSDRFEFLTELWQKQLEKRFDKKFKPIWVLSAKQNNFFSKENYLIINKNLKGIMDRLAKNNIVYLLDSEDLNKEFSESRKVKEIINKLVEKQNRVFIVGFTSSCLHIENPKVKILGPDPSIATKFDNKIEHIKLFEKLGLPRNKTRIYETIKEIKENEKCPFFISAAYTSGGHESKIVRTKEDLDIFYSSLREINKSNEFLVADFIENVSLSPNVSAFVVDKDDVRIVCITDQILRNCYQYLGNIYPSKASKESEQKIIETTKIIGNYLANLGFRGLFGLDFIIDEKENLYTVDLNPRRQGGYLCNVLISKKINIPEIELNLALNEEIPEFNYKDFQVDYVWAHTKIKPYYNPEGLQEIISCFSNDKSNKPFIEIGKEFKYIFYPEKSLFCGGGVGCYIITGYSYEAILSKIKEKTEMILLDCVRHYSLIPILKKLPFQDRKYIITTLELSSEEISKKIKVQV